MRSATWDADRDMMRHNPIHAAERDEHRSALKAQTGLERASGCQHSRRGARVCPDCGHDIRSEL